MKGVPETVCMEQTYFEDCGVRLNSPGRLLKGPTRLLGSLQKPDVAQQGSLMPRINCQYPCGHGNQVSQSTLPIPPASPDFYRSMWHIASVRWEAKGKDFTAPLTVKGCSMQHVLSALPHSDNALTWS